MTFTDDDIRKRAKMRRRQIDDFAFRAAAPKNNVLSYFKAKRAKVLDAFAESVAKIQSDGGGVTYSDHLKGAQMIVLVSKEVYDIVKAKQVKDLLTSGD